MNNMMIRDTHVNTFTKNIIDSSILSNIRNIDVEKVFQDLWQDHLLLNLWLHRPRVKGKWPLESTWDGDG